MHPRKHYYLGLAKHYYFGAVLAISGTCTFLLLAKCVLELSPREDSEDPRFYLKQLPEV
jgi:hypothetical protein